MPSENPQIEDSTNNTNTNKLKCGRADIPYPPSIRCSPPTLQDKTKDNLMRGDKK